MQIVLFGATGGLGEQLLQQALEQGHTVRAVVRTPSKLSVQREGLEVVQGDVINNSAAELAEKLKGADAVISALGQGRYLGITNFYSTGIQTLIEASKDVGIRRFIIISSSGTDVTTEEPWWYLWFAPSSHQRLHRPSTHGRTDLSQRAGLDRCAPPHC